MTDIYIRLTYDEYKEMEEQMKEFPETTHTSVEGFYHKALRIKCGALLFEFQGPMIKAPLYD